MTRVGVLHVIDSLDAGGAERMAVNLVNHLPPDRYTPYLCTTRRDGPLAGLVSPAVGRLQLRRSRTFGGAAFLRLIDFARKRSVQILHAHGTSLFLSMSSSLFARRPAVIWHVHSGKHVFEERAAWLYQEWARRASGVIAVNRDLADWCSRRLRVPPGRVWCIPNFVCHDELPPLAMKLPGVDGARIVSVANFRREKDHLTLLRAMAAVVRKAPDSHLLLVGAFSDAACTQSAKTETLRLNIGQHVSFLGPRHDVAAVLRSCDVGVLSSSSEGFPLALIEYGMAGLPVAATRVGECPEVLEQGLAGILVAPGNPEQLADALLGLLRSPEQRVMLGLRLQERARRLYSPEPVIRQVCQVYETILQKI